MQQRVPNVQWGTTQTACTEEPSTRVAFVLSAFVKFSRASFLLTGASELLKSLACTAFDGDQTVINNQKHFCPRQLMIQRRSGGCSTSTMPNAKARSYP